MSATEQLLAERYGRGPANSKRRRHQVIGLGSTLLTLFLAWAIVINFFAGGGVSATTDSFAVIDANHSSVHFTVSGAAGRAARCEISASNGEFQVVGFRSFYVPAAKSNTQSFDTTLNTTERPFSLSVQNCHFR